MADRSCVVLKLPSLSLEAFHLQLLSTPGIQTYLGELARFSLQRAINLLEIICSRIFIIYLWNINKKLILTVTVLVGKVFQGSYSDKNLAIYKAIAGLGYSHQRLHHTNVAAFGAGLQFMYASYLSQLQSIWIHQVRPCTRKSCQPPPKTRTVQIVVLCHLLQNKGDSQDRIFWENTTWIHCDI